MLIYCRVLGNGLSWVPWLASQMRWRASHMRLRRQVPDTASTYLSLTVLKFQRAHIIQTRKSKAGFIEHTQQICLSPVPFWGVEPSKHRFCLKNGREVSSDICHADRLTHSVRGRPCSSVAMQLMPSKHIKPLVFPTSSHWPNLCFGSRQRALFMQKETGQILSLDSSIRCATKTCSIWASWLLPPQARTPNLQTLLWKPHMRTPKTAGQVCPVQTHCRWKEFGPLPSKMGLVWSVFMLPLVLISIVQPYLGGWYQLTILYCYYFNIM